MLSDDIERLANELEQQELETPTGEANPQIYAKLLAIYLYQNDLCNAKFLWKRIPANIKAENPELSQIWAVGQNLWKRDFPATYKSLNSVNWSSTVSEIMKNVEESIRIRAVELITKAYSFIKLDTIAAMTGLEKDACANECIAKGWKIESNTEIVQPLPKTLEPIVQPSSLERLSKLTDFVSFLEN